MDDTATHESGPVDAPASIESIAAEIAAGGEDKPVDAFERIAQEMVNDAEGKGDSEEEPETEDDATEPADEAKEPDEGTPEGTVDTDPFAKLLATNPDLKVKVKVNGEVIEVPLSDLPNGYSRMEDYKAKTAAVAEERREVEALRANAEYHAEAKFTNQLEEATNLFAQFDPVLSEVGNIDWEALKQQDPAAYVQAQDAVNERIAAIQQMNATVKQNREHLKQAQQAQIEQERAQRFDKAADEIVKVRPELAEQGKFLAFANEAIDYMKSTGFTGEEIIDSLDHRILSVVDKARQWDAHVAARQSLPEKRVVPKSAVRPLTSDGTGSTQPRPRFPKNAPRDVQHNWIAQQIRSSEE